MSDKKAGLTRAQEISLHARIVAGDPRAAHELVEYHLEYAIVVATRLSSGSFPGDELRSAAVTWLDEAFRTWDAPVAVMRPITSHAARKFIVNGTECQV